MKPPPSPSEGGRSSLSPNPSPNGKASPNPSEGRGEPNGR